MDNDNRYLDTDRRIALISQYVVLVSMALYYSYRFREIRGIMFNYLLAAYSALALSIIYILVNHLFVSKLISHKRLIIHEIILILTIFALIVGESLR